METDIIDNKLRKNSSEEIFAEDYDEKKKSSPHLKMPKMIMSQSVQV